MTWFRSTFYTMPFVALSTPSSRHNIGLSPLSRYRGETTVLGGRLWGVQCVCVGMGGGGLEVLVLGRNDPDLDGLMEM